jgi:hypothetical protein
MFAWFSGSNFLQTLAFYLGSRYFPKITYMMLIALGVKYWLNLLFVGLFKQVRL